MSARVAVITGAASGIGRALAQRCARQGMTVVLADIDEAQLAAAESFIGSAGGDLYSRVTDVSCADSVEALAKDVYAHFGAVNLLCNNAGILQTGVCWEESAPSWRRAMDINFMGVLHGVSSFVPRMLEQEQSAHIVNTGSLGALLAAPLMGPYTASKMAVRGLTETLHYELRSIGASVGVSLLCPGPIETSMAASAAGRASPSPTAQALMTELMSEDIVPLSPEACAEIVLDAVAEGRFWIFTHPEFKRHYVALAEELADERNPQYRSAW
ncbi:SDR family NAD(P)-dependent oxidoreductase [Haliea salexigens]|nr:SDR family NAD(P)-dependent oxidoreductase [Haliea salexigens]MAA88077.1 SDR family oxidoreductase [Haliea sp.]|tara:strand:- start:12477 stop:13289 length:813 start_codon:yes stop_codon:yes gene_type:complete